MKIRHILISMLVTVMLFSCDWNDGKERQSLLEVSKQELATALEERDQLLALVKEVSAGLEQIKQLENIMAIASTRPDRTAAQKARILADIASLKKKIEQRKARLEELENKLQKSTINSKDLHETIAALRLQMDSQIDEIESLRLQMSAANEYIGVLNHVVDSLSTTVSAVTDERDAALENSVHLENELNTCYFLIATKSELQKYNILESSFLRKTKFMKGDFDKSAFVTSDRRHLTSLPLNTTKAKILTNHPEKSFKLVDENGQKVIKITDPDLFWSLSSYLVVQK